MERYFRSCEKECLVPVSGKVTGEVPKWLKGNLLRDGPGLLKVGPDSYNHLFDGLAIIHKFKIEDGQISYQNAFVKSNTYLRNMKANRIVVTEVGTKGQPDPCLTIFGRLMHYFEKTDNTSVNIFPYGDSHYAATETSVIHRIDPDTLETVGSVDIAKLVAVNAATAHPHFDNDGTYYNLGSKFSTFSSHYNVISFPAGGDWSKGKIECSVPATFPRRPAYSHSFGMSKEHFILAEISMMISIPKMMWVTFKGESFADGIEWHPEDKSRFRVVQRSDGKELKHIQYVAEPFVMFHQINSYEEDGHIVTDLCCYNDGNIIHKLYFESLKDPNQKLMPSEARRYVLPLTIPKDAKVGDNIVTLASSNAKAILQPNGSLLCEHEPLIKEEILYIEFPRINYGKVNGLKYKYFYGYENDDKQNKYSLIKCDVETGKIQRWQEPDAYPGEPVFVAAPDGVEEDDGIILSSVLDIKDDKKVILVILDAKTFTEIARAEFITPGAIPPDFHGNFTATN